MYVFPRHLARTCPRQSGRDTEQVGHNHPTSDSSRNLKRAQTSRGHESLSPVPVSPYGLNRSKLDRTKIVFILTILFSGFYAADFVLERNDDSSPSPKLFGIESNPSTQSLTSLDSQFVNKLFKTLFCDDMTQLPLIDLNS